MTNLMTIPDAIEHLFGIKVARDSAYLKTKATSLERNGLIRVVREKIAHTNKVYLADSEQLTVLHNALVLNAIYPDPKDIKRIFEEPSYRSECVKTVKQILQSRNNIVGVALQSTAVNQLIEILESEQDLFKQKLPNPFTQLPQVALGKNGGLLNVLLAQAASTATLDNLLHAYLSGDWEKSSILITQLDSNVSGAAELKNYIQNQLVEAEEMEDLLEAFLKM